MTTLGTFTIGGKLNQNTSPLNLFWIIAENYFKNTSLTISGEEARQSELLHLCVLETDWKKFYERGWASELLSSLSFVWTEDCCNNNIVRMFKHDVNNNLGYVSSIFHCRTSVQINHWIVRIWCLRNTLK